MTLLEVHDTTGEVFAVSVPEDVWRAVQTLAAQHAMSPAVCVRSALRVWLSLHCDTDGELRLTHDA